MDLELKSWRICALAYCVGFGSLCPAASVPGPFIYTEAPKYETNPNRCCERFAAGARLHIVENGKDRLLMPGFAASADASVSFDGRRILFAGKQKAADPWQIWELAIAGGAPRRITSGKQDAVTPFYMPPEKIVYSVRTASGFQIELMPIEGGIPLRLTYGPGDHLITDVLRDGRVMFEAPHPSVPSGARDIYTVYVDGSGIETYRCDHTHDRRAARQLRSGDVVFEAAGRLAYFTSPRAVEVAFKLPVGAFSGPVAELPGGEWLVAYRAPGETRFGICVWKPGTTAPVRIAGFPSANAVEPVAVAPHAVPKRHPSGLGNREGANLLALNVYTSREKVPAGSVAAVRVWTLDGRGSPVLLGTAPVEPDGSFFVQTPSESPLRFELLNAAGATVAREKGWFWARRGEQRVCAGCHAGPERSPDNVAPQVLTKSPEPVKLLQSQGVGAGGVK